MIAQLIKGSLYYIFNFKCVLLSEINTLGLNTNNQLYILKKLLGTLRFQRNEAYISSL